MKHYTNALKKYAQFTGRASRAEFWYFFLINLAISFVLGFIGGLLDFALIGSLYSLAVIVPLFAVGARRMHDVGKSGWFYLIPLYDLYLAILEGESGVNQYGPEPVD